jgi:hypothetical protein
MLKKKNKKNTSANTALPPTRRQKPTPRKAKRRRVCGSANVLGNQKKENPK